MVPYNQAPKPIYNFLNSSRCLVTYKEICTTAIDQHRSDLISHSITIKKYIFPLQKVLFVYASYVLLVCIRMYLRVTCINLHSREQPLESSPNFLCASYLALRTVQLRHEPLVL